MPVYIVKFGECVLVYYARHHTEQMCRALRLNGTPYTLTNAREE